MKNFLKYVAALAIVGAFFVACSDWTDPEREITQHPDQQSPILRDNAYYQALREYKKTKHKIAFGWYGSWTAMGASYQTRLQSAPDSMDIISIWSQWHSLTPEQIADKEFVQKIKGTKVTFTIFSDKMPEPFLTEIGGGEYTDEAIEAYAKAYCKDSMDKYSYDGIDIDYEPGYGASGPFVGHDNELFRKLILAMSKYVGPKSGTGRLLMIDGVPYAVHADVADCFDYGIVQAYKSYGYTDLQSRFDEADKKGWKPEQYIFAENFESLWKNGGVSHECRDGQWVNSLLGMARFNPTQGFGAGFGAYHMEYEYGNSAMPYKYMREAIQDVNPAGGDLIVGLTSTALSKYLFLVGDDGTITGEVDEKIRVELARPAPADVSFPLALDNSLVEAYNEEHGTSYEAIDPARVSLGTLSVAAGDFMSDEASVTVSSANIEKGYYLLPIVVELPQGDVYTSKEKLVRYVLVTVAAMEIDVDATALTGVKIEPASGWTIVCYQGTASSGANGVWNLDSDAQKARMFDGKFHHHAGQGLRHQRLPLAYLLRGLQPRMYRFPVQRGRHQLVQPDQRNFVRPQTHGRRLEDIPVQEDREGPLYPGIRRPGDRVYQHERGRDFRPCKLNLKQENYETEIFGRSAVVRRRCGHGLSGDCGDLSCDLHDRCAEQSRQINDHRRTPCRDLDHRILLGGRRA